ncbi:hypothetical protein C8R44DRAFT_904573 [Mycena epipterygia]|nr:hypothetical protein C8R44DRAFT_904573 [Mycena epipterygia]
MPDPKRSYVPKMDEASRAGVAQWLKEAKVARVSVPEKRRKQPHELQACYEMDVGGRETKNKVLARGDRGITYKIKFPRLPVTPEMVGPNRVDPTRTRRQLEGEVDRSAAQAQPWKVKLTDQRARAQPWNKVKLTDQRARAQPWNKVKLTDQRARAQPWNKVKLTDQRARAQPWNKVKLTDQRARAQPWNKLSNKMRSAGAGTAVEQGELAISLELMAEFSGFVGAAVTIAATTLSIGSGFTGRHEGSHRQEMLETHRITDDFNVQNRQSGGVTPDKKNKFLETRVEATRRESEYHEQIEGYKRTSWFRPLKKLKKKKDVRKAKRAIRQSNHSLRTQLNESMHSGFNSSGDIEDQATWSCSVQ